MDSSDSDMDEQDISFENRWDRRDRHHPLHSIDQEPIPYHNSISPWNKENDGVTTLYKCNVTDAKVLYIFDCAYKLQLNDQYDIGGAYTENDAGLWFYFTTLSGPGRIYLMNIFVCQRKPGMFSVGISNANTVTSIKYNNEKVKTLNDDLQWYNFNTTQPDQTCYIKTYCFTDKDRVSLDKKVLIIPIAINMDTTSTVNQDVVQKIKADLEFGSELLKDEEPDFIIKSNEGKEFKVHKIVLAAHSPVLRDMVRNENTLSLNMANIEIELLMEYLYTGLVKNILNQQLEMLLVTAEKFQLNNLTSLIKHAMTVAITSENALNVAVVAEKFDCKEIQEVAFKYIASHPEVLESDAFSQINNANMVKKLLKYIHVKQ